MKAEYRQKRGDKKKRNKAETKHRDRKEGIPCTEFPEGGDPMHTDRPLESPLENSCFITLIFSCVAFVKWANQMCSWHLYCIHEWERGLRCKDKQTTCVVKHDSYTHASLSQVNGFSRHYNSLHMLHSQLHASVSVCMHTYTLTHAHTSAGTITYQHNMYMQAWMHAHMRECLDMHTYTYTSSLISLLLCIHLSRCLLSSLVIINEP